MEYLHSLPCPTLLPCLYYKCLQLCLCLQNSVPASISQIHSLMQSLQQHHPKALLFGIGRELALLLPQLASLPPLAQLLPSFSP